jgi:hypothetical protein
MRKYAHLILVVLGGAATCADAQTTVFTAKPKFRQQGAEIYLVIDATNHSFEIEWWLGSASNFFPVTLDTNRVYNFTFTNIGPTGASIPELRKVQLGGQTIYDIEVCEVHHCKMEYKTVPVLYGRMPSLPDDPSFDTERRLFPHRPTYSGYSSFVQPMQAKRMYVCSQCEEAFDWWSGSATAPDSVLPKVTRYDSDQHLRQAFLEAYGKGYVAAWARKESLPIFSPTTDEEKARVFGFSDGLVAGRAARDAWSGANGQRYGQTNSTSQKR